MQLSLCVQALPSLHVEPSVFDGFEQAPVLGLHVPAAWHWSLAVQVTGLEPVHVPAMQLSLCVQALPSLQLEPSLLAGLVQAPVVGLQVPAEWHWSLAVQVFGLAPVHVPATQVSVWVQALPSLQLVPSVFAGLEQAPLVGSQVPALWHWSDAAQVFGLAPVQVPETQVSLWVQALPSLQLVPSVFAGFEQTPVDVLHVPAL